jgi:hypothetical protein
MDGMIKQHPYSSKMKSKLKDKASKSKLRRHEEIPKKIKKRKHDADELEDVEMEEADDELRIERHSMPSSSKKQGIMKK